LVSNHIFHCQVHGDEHPILPDEAAASAAVSSFIAKHVSKMALSLGGATILESAVSEIGIFDDDNKAVVGGDSDYNDEDLRQEIDVAK
jgi:hypothetical protein